VGEVGRFGAAELTYADSGPTRVGATTVLALHGLTSTSQVWQDLAQSLPDVRVVAPDLAGRGGSVGVAAGPGLVGHAESVLRLVHELGLGERPGELAADERGPGGLVVIGHSMGAFLAPLVAAGLGDRVRRVVLVDGGVAPERSLMIRRPVVRALFWTQMKIVGRPWRDAAAFVDKVEGRAIRNRPELRAPLIGWAEYALAGPPGRLRPRLDAARCTADAVDALTGAATLGALAGSDVPVHLIAAARGADDGKPPFVSDAAIEAGRRELPRLTVERVDGNHLTMLFDARLAAAVAGLL